MREQYVVHDYLDLEKLVLYWFGALENIERFPILNFLLVLVLLCAMDHRLFLCNYHQ